MDLSNLHWFELDQIYTKARREVRKRPEWRFGPERVYEVAREGYLGFKDKIGIIDKTYCDLGCETFHPFGVSAVMYINGAKDTIALNLESSNEHRAAEALADLIEDIICFPKKWHWSEISEVEFITRTRKFDLNALRSGDLHKGIESTPMRHIITDIHNPILGIESIDIMTSRAALEHFLDFKTASDRLLELLKPGGYAFHFIDIVDHRAYEDDKFHYWSFLTEDENWTDGVCNRLRSFQIKQIFEKSGFNIISFNTVLGEPPAGFLSKVSNYFKQMPESELKATGVSCLLHKENANTQKTAKLQTIEIPGPGVTYIKLDDSIVSDSDKLESPSISLPDLAYFTQKSQHETGWVDHYGALYIASTYCDIDLPDDDFPHLWQHGCIPPWITVPELHIYNTPSPNRKKLFVARQDEVELLTKAGINSATAIGLPFIYTPQIELERIPNSLLIMPQHTLAESDAGSKAERLNYVEQIARYKDKFNLVIACISPNCLKRGYFIEELNKHDIEIIEGTQTADANAYLRIYCLLNQFESMTTNAWGSHVAYALYSGMKVSLFGDRFNVSEESNLNDVTFATMDRSKFNIAREQDNQNIVNELSHLYSSPDKGILDKHLGSKLLGAENKKTPQELKLIFGW